MGESVSYVIGIDLGGTNARAMLATGDATRIGEYSLPSQSHGPPEATFDVLARCVDEVLAQHQVARTTVAGIGVGLPGIITQGATCVWSPNFPQWHDVPIRDLLVRRTGLPSFFMNDARCATLAELRLGAGRGVESMVFVGLGTGIGGGIVIDGRLLLGRNGSVGEIAHHTIDPDGPRCSCGNFGCWEAFCGRDHIVERAYRRLQTGRETLLANRDRELTPQTIAEAASAGDTLANEIMAETGYYVGIGVANLITMLNPRRVVIGGGIALAGELLFAPVRRTVLARAVRFQAADCDIVPAQLGSDAGVFGAALLALDALHGPRSLEGVNPTGA